MIYHLVRDAESRRSGRPGPPLTVRGRVSTVSPDSSGDLRFQLAPATSSPAGTYDLAVTLGKQSAELGGLQRTEHADFTIDRTAPVPSLNQMQQSLYPVVDGYHDLAWLTPNADNAGGRFDLDVVNRAGTAVRHWTDEQALAPGDVAWDGRDDTGKVVPEGVYHAELLVEDVAGNRATTTSGAITVSRKRLVTKTWRRVFLAKATLVRRDNTRCSVVRTPSNRDWRGSVGYYSNQRCRASSFAGSVASGVHAVQLPSALKPGSVTLWAYGGAAKVRSHSTAHLAAYRSNGEFLPVIAPLGHKVKWHRAPAHSANNMLGRDRVIARNVFTQRGARYDIRGFEVDYRYQVLAY